MEGKVRVRSVNFTPAEKQVLLALVNKYKEIIENKKTDNTSANEKTSTWTKITQEFNSQSPALVPRTTDSLKKYYENLKKTIRKKAASEKAELYQTGGGKGQKKITEDDELLLSLVNKKTIYGLKNPFDNDELPSSECTQDHMYYKIGENYNKYEKEVPLMGTSEIVDMTWNNNEITIETENVDAVEDHNEGNVETLQPWKKYKPIDLQSPLRESNRENTKIGRRTLDSARRRPTPVGALTSSALAEKYQMLVDKKLEYMECLRKEHELRYEALKLEIEIKKKELQKSQ